MVTILLKKNKELARLREVNSTEYKMSAYDFLGLGDNVCTH